MKHYPHHIGDFDRATRHLSRIERSIYRDLMDLYYDTESMLPLDIRWICRRILATSNDESTGVQQVLNEFFDKTAAGWYHSRCEEELEKYRSNNSQKAEAGKASAAKRALMRQQALNARSTNDERQSNGDSTNQSTINQSTIQPLKEKASPSGSRLAPDWSLPDDWKTWAEQERPELDVLTQAASFADYWHGVAGAKGRKADWLATWRNWIRNSNAGSRPRAGPNIPQEKSKGRQAIELLEGLKHGMDAQGNRYGPAKADMSRLG